MGGGTKRGCSQWKGEVVRVTASVANQRWGTESAKPLGGYALLKTEAVQRALSANKIHDLRVTDRTANQRWETKTALLLGGLRAAPVEDGAKSGVSQ